MTKRHPPPSPPSHRHDDPDAGWKAYHDLVEQILAVTEFLVIEEFLEHHRHQHHHPPHHRHPVSIEVPDHRARAHLTLSPPPPPPLHPVTL